MPHVVGIVMRRKIRVLVLHNSLSPYRIPLFREIAKSHDLYVDFLFSRVKEDNRLWEFDSELGFNCSVIDAPEVRVKNKKLFLWAGVRGFSKKYDIFVVNDHLNIPELVIQLYAKIFGKPILRWLASTENSIQLESKISQSLKVWLNRISTAILVPGREARDYALNTTKSTIPVHICNNVVDNTVFAQAREFTHEFVDDEKRRLDLHGPVISYFGQLIPRKGLDVLIRAIDLLPDDLVFSLLLVGEGELLEEATKIFSNKKANLVTTGYVNPSMLATYYALTDVTVLPSHIDTWGMVVNESMAAGKPVICSTGAGAARDLIDDGKTGFVFKKNNAELLSNQLKRLISSKGLRDSMSSCADLKLRDYTIDFAANQFCEAIKKTVCIN